jgi:hypothetical protein
MRKFLLPLHPMIELKMNGAKIVLIISLNKR